MFNYILYRLGQLLALSLPLSMAYRIAVLVSDIRYLYAKKDRETVKENLKAIFPDKSDKELKLIRIATFRNFAKYLVDFFRFSKLDKEYIKNNIKLENIRYIDEALSKGKGVIITTAHLGNWELGGVVISLLGYPFWVVALPHKHKRVDNFFNFQRESKGIKVIPLGKQTVKDCLNVLKERKIVALVGDRHFGERGMMLDFFGRPALFPHGPAVFSLKTGAPIVPGFMLRNDDDTFTFKFEKPIELTPTGDKTMDALELTRRYISIFENYIRVYPEQWYMFRRFWAE